MKAPMFRMKRAGVMFCLGLLLSTALTAGDASATPPSPRLSEPTAAALTIVDLSGRDAVLRKAEKVRQRAKNDAAVQALRTRPPLARSLEAVPGLPYVRLTLDSVGLARLETIPGLTRITRAEEMNWQRDQVELKQAAMMAARGRAQLDVVSPTVIGGRTADPGTHPFQMSLAAKAIRNDRAAHMCGGVLVARRFVLAAAHCSEYDPQTVQVVVGSQRLDGSGSRFNVSKIHLHPAYFDDTTQWGYDVAV